MAAPSPTEQIKKKLNKRWCLNLGPLLQHRLAVELRSAVNLPDTPNPKKDFSIFFNMVISILCVIVVDVLVLVDVEERAGLPN